MIEWSQTVMHSYLFSVAYFFYDLEKKSLKFSEPKILNLLRKAFERINEVVCAKCPPQYLKHCRYKNVNFLSFKKKIFF